MPPPPPPDSSPRGFYLQFLIVTVFFLPLMMDPVQTDAKGKGKSEELADSIGSLSIGPERTNFKKKPVIIIVIGMAGTGKTTFMHRLVCHTQASNMRGYVLNLDPAVMTLPFGANIDIRDTVRYKEVMKEYGLGPNGGILTSLNLFSTKFDEVCFSIIIYFISVCV
jgi:ABC-type proline/glycine betaine transport system ATPase subunit